MNDDPGWGSPKDVLLGLLPFGPMMRIGRATQRPPDLVTLRAIFLSFITAIVLIGVVVLLLVPGMEPSVSGTTAALTVLALGVAGQVASGLIARPLDCTSPTTLATSYRTRFFLRLAFAESAALMGFVGANLSANLTVYLVGAAITAVGFTRLAPTAANLGRDQEELAGRGCRGSLIAALQ
ncbi:MAG: hypothetical protein JWN29_3412 [Acidimicrobiales bacterium]|nr:hypothetical protein [Acidimicrobiales bacterium]